MDVKTKTLTLIIAAVLTVFPILRMQGAAVDVKIFIDDSVVVTDTYIDKYSTLYGIQPGNMFVDVVIKDSVDYHIFESVGCSCYEIRESYLTFEFTAYSDISILYFTFCAIEDLEPIKPEWCNIKFHLIFDKDGLRGDVAIINTEGYLDMLKEIMGEYYMPLPDMQEVLDNIQGEYYYPYVDALHLLIDGYLCKGVPTCEILDFMEAFKKAIDDNGIEHDSQRCFEQDYYIYKFILEHKDKTLDIDDLKEYAAIAYRLNEFYGNHFNH